MMMMMTMMMIPDIYQILEFQDPTLTILCVIVTLSQKKADRGGSAV